MAFKLDYNQSDLKKNLDKMSVKLGAVVLMYAATKASELQAKMKTNRPWTDRTGRAKQSLNSSWKWVGDVARVELSHGVYYGIYLELCNEKRYAIIKPTIDIISPQAIRGLNKILK